MPAKVTIKFGLSEGELLFQTTQTPLGTTHQIAIDEKILIPGTTFFYKVIADTADGKTNESSIQSFKTKGFTVTFKVLDKDKKPVQNKKFTLFSEPQTATSDDDGVVTFENVAPGNHTLETEQGKQKLKQQVSVANTLATDSTGLQSAQAQNVVVTFAELTAARSLPTGIIIGTVILTVLVLGFVVSRRGGGSGLGGIGNRFFGRDHALTPGPIDTTTQFTQPTSPIMPDNGLIGQIPDQEKPSPGTTIAPKITNDKEQE